MKNMKAYIDWVLLLQMIVLLNFDQCIVDTREISDNQQGETLSNKDVLEVNDKQIATKSIPNYTTSDADEYTSRKYPESMNQILNLSFYSTTLPDNDLVINQHIIGKTQRCADGNLYFSLDDCQDDCLQWTKGDLYVNSWIPLRDKIKIVQVQNTDYRLLPDGQIVLNFNGKHFPRDSYFLEGDYEEQTARVCYPMKSSLADYCKFFQVIPITKFHRENYGLQMLESPKTRLEVDDYFIVHEDSKPDEVWICDHARHNVHLIGTVISSVALGLTLILIQFVEELKKSVNVIVKCHIVMLFFSFVILSIRYAVLDKPPAMCLISALLQQFCFLSAFFWMSIVALDLYLILAKPSYSSKSSWRIFTYYSAFSWGLAGLISSFTLIAELLQIPIINPQLEENCWFVLGWPYAFLYYYGWMALSLLFNILLLPMIVFQFRKLSNNTNSSSKNFRLQILFFSIKLVVIMGLFFIFKILYWAESNTDGFGVLWYLDCLTNFHGVLIFLVFVFKPSFIKAVIQRMKRQCRGRTEENDNYSFNTIIEEK